MSKKLIVILGSTASGKSEIAVKLALQLCSEQAKKKFEINGAEIISADSRQVYRGMDIGTGKILKKEMKGVPHHLLDVVSPNKVFTVVQYQKLTLKAINQIFKKGKIPILCGGTGFYIQAIVDGIIIPEVKPDWKLRDRLEKKSAKELFNRLKKVDPKRAKTIERKNKRRLIRALEIILKTKKPVPLTGKKPLPYPILILGIKIAKKDLGKKIEKRIKKMFKEGLEIEVENLVKKYGLIPALQTIGYQEWQDYFNPVKYDAKGNLTRVNKKITKKQVLEIIKLHTLQLAKRQMTWFKRDKRIKWIKKQPEAEKLVKEFLNK